ncbi:TetR/AcrR family transcriptional regulator [Nocardia niigatensis]
MTIRRLAAAIGIGTTTLYRHVQDKGDLLMLLNHYAGQAERPDLPDDPRDRIAAAAGAMHDTLAGRPWAGDPHRRRVRRPARRISAVDGRRHPRGSRGLRVHTGSGFRSIWFYMVGEILVRAHSVREGAPEAAAGRASSSGLDPSRCRAWPRSARAGPRSPPAMPTIRGCARSSMVC